VVAHEAESQPVGHKPFYQVRDFPAVLATVNQIPEKYQRPAMRVTPTFTDIISKCNS
jgi:hypothetical protein